MKLSVVRGGGVAGTVVRTDLASGDLSPEDAGTLHELVRDAGLLEGGQREPPPARPDEPSYKLTVEHAGHSHTVSLTESTMPEAIRSLISWSDSVPGGKTRIEPPGPPAE
jgi:hypothetical protein